MSAWGAALVLAPGLLALALSAVGLDARSLGFDEGATVAITAQSGHGLWRAIARDGGNMSGYYLLLHVLIGWFGDGPWVLRTPSAVFAGVTAGLVGALGLTLFDRRTAAIAGLLGALSLPLVYWGETARSYSAMICFATAGMLAFVRFLRALERGRSGWGALAAYVAAMTLAAYASFVAVLIVSAQLAVLARRPRALRRFLPALAALGALGVPLAILAVRRGSGQLFWLGRPKWPAVEQVLQMLSSAGLGPSFRREATTTGGWVLTVLALLGLWRLGWGNGRGRLAWRGAGGSEPVRSTASREDGVRLVLAWAVVPGALAFVYSLVAPQPIFLSRNVLVSMPAVALALGALLADRRTPRWALAAGLAASLVVRLTPLLSSYGTSPEAWGAATVRVIDDDRPHDCVAFYPEDGRNAFRWYLDRAHPGALAPRAILPALAWRASTPEVEIYRTISASRIAALPERCPRLWLVSSHEGEARGPSGSRRHLKAFLWMSYRLERVYGPASITTVGYASRIHVALLTRHLRGAHRRR